ncbi:MAG: N-acetyltransferase family protein [Hyphomicrobiaceae bacterium]
MDYEISPAREEHAPWISEANAVVYAKHVVAEPWLFKDAALSAAVMTPPVARDDTVMRVAVCDGQVIGYIYAQSRAFSESAPTRGYRALYIHHICVGDEFRRRGIASALVNAVREFAAESHIERLTADL